MSEVAEEDRESLSERLQRNQRGIVLAVALTLAALLILLVHYQT
jgi:hypothetical protein